MFKCPSEGPELRSGTRNPRPPEVAGRRPGWVSGLPEARWSMPQPLRHPQPCVPCGRRLSTLLKAKSGREGRRWHPLCQLEEKIDQVARSIDQVAEVFHLVMARIARGGCCVPGGRTLLPAPRHTRLRMRKGLRCDPACLRQPSDPPWSPSGRLWGSGVPSTRSQFWALGRAFEHACRPVSGRASRLNLKNASLAEASLGLSRLQKERPHGWRGGPRQSRDERRFVWVDRHRCSKWATKAEPREGDNQGRTTL